MDLGESTERYDRQERSTMQQYSLSLVSAPISLTIINDEDTSNFNEIDKQDRVLEETFSSNKAFAGNQLSFIGFSFSNEQQ